MTGFIPTYVAGSLVELNVLFTNADTGVPADPTTVIVKVQLNGDTGAIVSHTYPDPYITKVSTGAYKIFVDTTGTSGPGVVQWEGSGALQAASFTQFFVQAAPLGSP